MTAVISPAEFVKDWEQLAAAGLTDQQIAERFNAGACTTELCDGKHYAKGLCQHCYQQTRTAQKRHTIDYPTSSKVAAAQAEMDVMELATLVRDVDPNDVWKRISRWGETRLACAFIAAVAMIPVDDASPDQLLAWCRDLQAAPAS